MSSRDRLNQSAAEASESIGPTSATMILDQLRAIAAKQRDIEKRLLSEEHVAYITRWVEERQALGRVGGRWKGLAPAVLSVAALWAVLWGGLIDMIKHALGLAK